MPNSAEPYSKTVGHSGKNKFDNLKVTIMEEPAIQTEEASTAGGGYKDGTDLILSTNGLALGHSTTCKISDSAETGERVTKEAQTGKFKEKYVKSLSETVTAEGFTYEGDAMGYPDLKTIMLAAQPVTLTYSYRANANNGTSVTTAYTGEFIITSLEETGDAGDDAKWNVTFENSGAVTPVGGE